MCHTAQVEDIRMLIPSGIQPPADHTVEVKQVAPGLYVATNAYVGVYSYFARLADDATAASTSGDASASPSQSALQQT